MDYSEENECTCCFESITNTSVEIGYNRWLCVDCIWILTENNPDSNSFNESCLERLSSRIEMIKIINN